MPAPGLNPYIDFITDGNSTSFDTTFTGTLSGINDTVDWGDGNGPIPLVNGTNTGTAPAGTTVKVNITNTAIVTQIKFTTNTYTEILFTDQGAGNNTLITFADMCNGLDILTSFDVFSSGTITLGEGVTDFSSAWTDCNNLTSFPLIDTSSGTDFPGTWSYCYNLSSFPLIDTSSGIDFSNTWDECTSLTSFPLLDFSSATTLTGAWANCENLTSFPLISIPNVTDLSYSWSGPINLTTFPEIDTSNVVNFQGSWQGCPFEVFPPLNTSSGTNFNYSWRGCSNLVCMDIVDTTQATTVTDMFADTSKLCSPNFSEQNLIAQTPGINWTATRICPPGSKLGANNACTIKINSTTAEGYIGDYKAWGVIPVPILFKMEVTAPSAPAPVATGGTLYVSNIGADLYKVWSYDAITGITMDSISTQIKIINSNTLTTANKMFNKCQDLVSVDLSGLDTSNITNMTDMFSSCNSLTSIDVSGFDTSNVTLMTSMFQDCLELTSIDVSGFDTSNVTHMDNMFWQTKKLTSIDLSAWDVSSVVYMDYMFISCSELISVNTSGWNTSSLLETKYMFQTCSKLEYADLSSWDMTNVIRTQAMFKDCASLICITNINTTASTDKTDMFYGCTALVQPDATAQADIVDSNGANWVNPGTCP